MTSDNSSKELCQLWQSQPHSPFQMSPEAMRNCMKMLNRTLLIRDATVWLVGLFEAGWFSWMLFALREMFIKVASSLIILGMGYMIVQTWLDQRRRRIARILAGESGNIDSIHFLRSELERQREFHRGLPFWSRLVALLPGLLTFGIAAIVFYPWPGKLVGYGVTAVTLSMVPLAAWLNSKRSRMYQRQIERLDALRQPPA
ncbi:MAG: hypothetical protein ABSG51_10310 [Terracidiphilus sp.]